MMTRELVVRWLNWRREPLGGWSYEITFNGSRHSGRLESDGTMHIAIDDSVRQVQFRICSTYPPGLQGLLEASCCEPELRGTLLIDALEAPSSIVGAQQRLRNLGYYDGPIEDGPAIETRSDAHMLRQAIIRYQREEQLALTGEIDPDTQLALSERYEGMRDPFWP